MTLKKTLSISIKKKNKTKKIKRELIGQGAYGCVYKPAFKCSSSKTTGEKIISKVMENYEAIDEITSYKLIDKIDPEGVFHIKLEKSCKLSEDNKRYVESNDECDLESEYNDTKYKNLQIAYGGKELYHYYQNINNIINGDIVVTEELGNINRLYKILVAYKNIVDGLIVLNKHDYSHFDIKLDNIVYDINTNVMKLIDFGLAIKYDFRLTKLQIKKVQDFADERQDFFISYYETYPFELILLKYTIFKYVLKHNNLDKIINRIRISYEDFDEDKEDSYYILQKPILKYYIRLAKRLVAKYNSNKIGYIAFIRLVFNKLDLYSVGISLKKLLDKYDILYNETLIKSRSINNPKSTRRAFNRLKKLTDEWLTGVTDPRVTFRWSVQKASDEYNKIYEYCKKRAK